jgi:hypothetical protein
MYSRLALTASLALVMACSGADDDTLNVTPATGGEGPAAGAEQIPEGPEGSVGNICHDDWTCDEDLVCGIAKHCQPSYTKLPFGIVQAVPTPGSANVPKYAPIMLFADGLYDDLDVQVMAHTIDEVKDITSDVVTKKLLSGAGKDVLVLAAKNGFPLGASVVVTLSGALEGALVYNVDHEAPASANDALSFEGEPDEEGSCDAHQEGAQPLPEGWAGFGDVGTVPAVGTLEPTDGSRLAALSSGEAVCGRALAQTSSLLVSGPIDHDGTILSFDYQFQSSEFDDYCHSAFDDTLLAVAMGPDGVAAEVVDSVNLVCTDGNQTLGELPGQPDGGDAIYKETGNVAYEMAAKVGSPARVAFVVTDVGDAILSTVVGIDDLRFTP